MTAALPDHSLDQIFRSARTFNGWADRLVEDPTVRAIYDLMKWGPTSANSSPARLVWVRSADGKTTLAGLAAEPNKLKILQAPVTVIIGHDLDFAAELPKLLPHAAEAMQQYFAAPGLAEVTAMRNGTLQGAYLIVAARALGLDCGPMSGFDNASVDKVFFSGTRIQSNFICSIGYGDPASVFPRNSRLSFEEAGRWA
ncbi:malonic semialdehyde reductase [Rhizobium sp. SG570]|uniref:malonic semialdehyde reductase n=1 Tax=Rhizobium sp. SG570 TaxID=2587113 RepID=UPI00144568CA|nr:malonic semialdehyde reductase [Rhizobium sp. SG570]NKJ36591.1 3-hydroxypropanoate dehydrogenase [Rhizobium sp. SG570]NRP90005.1 putative malonic semialdehyde reductase RutE [Ensifer adhaerens]